MTAPSGRPLVVQKLFHDGSKSYQWSGVELQRDDRCLLFAAVFEHEYRDLGYVVFERGDVFYEFYYFDRWYNVFQVYSKLGVLKGWYCNITAPARVADGELQFVDLALDLFVYPDRRFLVLDQEEFDELAQSTFSAAEVEAAKQAMAKLIDHARSGQLPSRPFDGAPAVVSPSSG